MASGAMMVPIDWIHVRESPPSQLHVAYIVLWSEVIHSCSPRSEWSPVSMLFSTDVGCPTMAFTPLHHWNPFHLYSLWLGYKHQLSSMHAVHWTKTNISFLMSICLSSSAVRLFPFSKHPFDHLLPSQCHSIETVSTTIWIWHNRAKHRSIQTLCSNCNHKAQLNYQHQTHCSIWLFTNVNFRRMQIKIESNECRNNLNARTVPLLFTRTPWNASKLVWKISQQLFMPSYRRDFEWNQVLVGVHSSNEILLEHSKTNVSTKGFNS